MGLDRVLVTCDNSNIGSARIIERNGGVLTREVAYGDEGKIKRHYWIDLGRQGPPG